MKSKMAKSLSHASDPIGRFIPKGSEDELRTGLNQLADLNRARLNRARSAGRTHAVLLGAEHVYRDPDTGQLVPASEAPQRAFVDGWELVGHRVHEQHRTVGNYDRAISDGARRSRVQQLRATTVTQPTGRAPREARNDRHRGSRRGESATSSSSDDPEPEPPGTRPCACGCGLPRRRGDHYAADDCRKRHARERKRRQRARDRASTERHVERRVDLGAELALPRSCDNGCGTEAIYLDPEGDVVCWACGRPRGRVTVRAVNGYDTRVRDLRRLMEADVATVRRPPPRPWRTRPNRSEAAQLRKTRKTYNAKAAA